MTTAAPAQDADLIDSRYRAPLVILTSTEHPPSVGGPEPGEPPVRDDTGGAPGEPAPPAGSVGAPGVAGSPGSAGAVGTAGAGGAAEGTAGAAVGWDCSVLAVVVTSVDGAAVVGEQGRSACARVGADPDRLIENEAFRGDAGGVLVVPLSRSERPWRLFLLGVGAGGTADWRSAGAALARRGGTRGRPFVVAEPDAEQIYAFVEGFVLGSYRPADAVTGATPEDAVTGTTHEAGTEPAPESAESAESAPDEPPAGPRAERILVLRTERAENPALIEAVRRARAVADGVCLARDLINMPSLVKTPRWLADQAVRAASQAGLGVTVLDHSDLVSQGFGGLVAVGGGSPRPPCLVTLTYDGPSAPGGRTPGHRVLVGKGITFDSGGLSLKPSVSMASMKTDMSGAAAVLGAMVTLAELEVPGKVTALLCLAENMIGASAVRPGDVITCWGGTTVEVLNTDAEGRLVLADGLAYAAATLAPDQIVDLATLTGAITVALGRRTAGLFSSDDTLAGELADAAGRAGERVWRLPLTEEYRPAIDSPVADLANIGRALDVNGGSITAALFLREFTAGLPWAHFDIAGTARADSDDGEISRGGTGWGVRTLIAYLAGAPAGEQPT
ncbi:leucyl aminopeptidase [Parafrankia sp. BMG5.11]|uniref:leucyl aminopeptidase n=1 Tax=Parafrankia sp. BMG5.11 TaxID=222540 RepID=UPI00103D0BBD|nr:leucyl aminopeptidase [Parafrankia sp. BMG5.11]TCJ40376.1 leucyl aminopeptidase [Parafrankia sp. BMG5.11]